MECQYLSPGKENKSHMWGCVSGLLGPQGQAASAGAGVWTGATDGHRGHVVEEQSRKCSRFPLKVLLSHHRGKEVCGFMNSMTPSVSQRS